MWSTPTIRYYVSRETIKFASIEKDMSWFLDNIEVRGVFHVKHLFP